MAEENKSFSNCAVCEEATDNHHLHYGAYCCLSCRAFFRRVNQKAKTKEYKCKKSGTCDVSFKNRKSCQRCRYVCENTFKIFVLLKLICLSVNFKHC